MSEYEKINRYGEEIEQLLRLKTSVIGVKFLKNEDEIPADATRPKRDMSVHLAQCQAFAMSRREGKSVALLKEDHWCWAPLIGFGFIDTGVIDEIDMDNINIDKIGPQIKGKNALEWVKELGDDLPFLEKGKYIGLLSAPLKTMQLIPDVVMVYSNNAQLRSMLMALKISTGYSVKADLEPFDSCVYSIVTVFLNGKYRVTFPDPGEYERTAVGEDKVIFSMHGDKLSELVEALKNLENMGQGYTGQKIIMKPDFPRPGFYDELFKAAGLDVSE